MTTLEYLFILFGSLIVGFCGGYLLGWLEQFKEDK